MGLTPLLYKPSLLSGVALPENLVYKSSLLMETAFPEPSAEPAAGDFPQFGSSDMKLCVKKTLLLKSSERGVIRREDVSELFCVYFFLNIIMHCECSIKLLNRELA